MSDDALPQLHLGAYALCIDPGDQLLLARMGTGADKGRWTLPGGGVEPGEHPDQAVLRELHEETGLVGSGGRPVVGVFSVVYERTTARPWGRVHHVGIVYDFRGVAGDIRDEQDGSTDRCAWFSREDAARLPLVALGEYGVHLAWRNPPPP